LAGVVTAVVTVAATAEARPRVMEGATEAAMVDMVAGRPRAVMGATAAGAAMEAAATAEATAAGRGTEVEEADGASATTTSELA